jgi:hypothetical protein
MSSTALRISPAYDKMGMLRNDNVDVTFQPPLELSERL